jgi:hypothetical protein
MKISAFHHLERILSQMGCRRVDYSAPGEPTGFDWLRPPMADVSPSAYTPRATMRRMTVMRPVCITSHSRLSAVTPPTTCVASCWRWAQPFWNGPANIRNTNRGTTPCFFWSPRGSNSSMSSRRLKIQHASPSVGQKIRWTRDEVYVPVSKVRNPTSGIALSGITWHFA